MLVLPQNIYLVGGGGGWKGGSWGRGFLISLAFFELSLYCCVNHYIDMKYMKL